MVLQNIKPQFKASGCTILIWSMENCDIIWYVHINALYYI